MVERHLTRLNEPWVQKGTGARGQTLLSNVKDPVYYHTEDDTGHEIGIFCRMWRVYRHTGLTLKSVADADEVRYFHEEYTFLREAGCKWVEFVPSSGCAERIDWNAFARYGGPANTQWGPMWIVPRKFYEGTTHVA